MLLLTLSALAAAGGCPPADTTETTANDNSASNDSSADVSTGILVTSPGAVAGIFDLYTGDAQTRLSQAHDMNEVLAADPGTYVLTDYFNPDFVLAANVVVVAGQVTTVPLGGIRVATIAGSEGATFDIYSAASDALLQRPNDSDVVIPVPPGVFRLRKYFNDAFVYGDAVTVVAGEVTVVPMGAFNLITPPGSDEASYDVYTADGQTVLSRPNSDNTVVPLPPGDYRIVEYFNELFPYTTITITAGALTTFEMGALRYDGPESNYDIYDASGSNLRVRPASRGAVRPLPPGDYVLKDYFSDVVLGGVTIRANEVTVTP